MIFNKIFIKRKNNAIKISDDTIPKFSRSILKIDLYIKIFKDRKDRSLVN